MRLLDSASSRVTALLEVSKSTLASLSANRSGIRASLYNAVTLDSVKALAEYIKSF